MRNRFVSMDRMPRPMLPKYRTTNWSEYYAALKSRASLDVWFDPRMGWFSLPSGRPGRPMRFSDQAIEFCLTLKGLFQLPLRQVTGLPQSLLRLAGLDWPAPDYTTLCRRQKSLSADLGGRSSSEGLHRLVPVSSSIDPAVIDVTVYAALDGRGSVSAEHGIGTSKKPWLGVTRTPTEITVMRSIKHHLDPQTILNPGRIF